MTNKRQEQFPSCFQVTGINKIPVSYVCFTSNHLLSWLLKAVNQAVNQVSHISPTLYVFHFVEI